jgi:hypothetical protein
MRYRAYACLSHFGCLLMDHHMLSFISNLRKYVRVHAHIAYGLCCVGMLFTPSVAHAEEQLMFAPQNWKMVDQQAQGAGIRQTWIPSSQSANNWSDVMLVAKMPGKQLEGALTLYKFTLESTKKRCEYVSAGDLQSASADGYQTSFWGIGCHKEKNSDQGSVLFFRAIMGIEALYLIQREFITPGYLQQDPPITPAQTEQTLLELRTAFVCNTDERMVNAIGGRLCPQ